MQMVTSVDLSTLDPLKSTMQYLRVTALEKYASKHGLECQSHFGKWTTDFVVEADESKGLDVINDMIRSEFALFHVYTEDEGLANYVESVFGKQVFVARCHYE